MFRSIPLKRNFQTIVILVAALLVIASSAHAADVLPGWGSWWLPPNRSAHGGEIDALFNLIFWITMVTFIVVEIVLLVFCIKYRHRADRKKAHFTHGNTRLEMAWTLAPAVILAVLALMSKKVWDNFRYGPASEDPARAKVLVIGEQFKWNIIYPGKDGKFGRYLMWPKPTDPRWPDPRPDSVRNAKDAKPYRFPESADGAIGPAYLGYDKAVGAIRAYIATINPLGKDFEDPDGKDDDYKAALARPVILPAHRPIEIQLSSKDVIHDFFLPNFRVKLDAVPGMRGHLYFTSLMTSADREKASRRKYPIDEINTLVGSPRKPIFNVIINEQETTEGAENYKPSRGPKYWRYADKTGKTIVRDGGSITPAVAGQLRDAGVKEVYAAEPGTWDLVCEELCGQGHGTMRGEVTFLDSDEYDKKGWDAPYKAATTQPSSIAAAAQ